MNRKRLSRLAALMDDAQARIDENPRVRFNLNTWADFSPDCGTTACACGHAALHPWFQREGLYLMFSYDMDGEEKPIENVRHFDQIVQEAIERKKEADENGREFGYDIRLRMRGVDQSDSMKVAAIFFGIDYNQAAHLFHPFEYRPNRATPADVARRIRTMLTMTEKPE